MLGMSPDVPLAELDVTSRQYGPGRYARNCYAQHHSSTGCHHAGARAIRTEEARCLLSVCVCVRVGDNKAHEPVTRKGGGAHIFRVQPAPRPCKRVSMPQL